MNWESIVTGVITGILSGGITGLLTTLYAMRQFKAQRAFDRQLDWYERTVRALNAVPHLNEDFVAAGDRSKAELEKALLDLRMCVDEAPLYAERSSYEHLQRMRIESKSDAKEAVKTFEEAMRATAVELSQPVRKMLRLKKIVLRK